MHSLVDGTVISRRESIVPASLEYRHHVQILVLEIKMFGKDVGCEQRKAAWNYDVVKARVCVGVWEGVSLLYSVGRTENRMEE